jgi:hypothetical protein
MLSSAESGGRGRAGDFRDGGEDVVQLHERVAHPGLRAGGPAHEEGHAVAALPNVRFGAAQRGVAVVAAFVAVSGSRGGFVAGHVIALLGFPLVPETAVVAGDDDDDVCAWLVRSNASSTAPMVASVCAV